MKKIIAIATILTVPSLALAQAPESETSKYEYNVTGEGVDLHFKVMKEPLYPIALKNKGINEGSVTVLLEIDYQGELRDWLVTEASHKDFGNAVDEVVGTWKFDPPIWKGKPISIVSAIEIRFRASGNIVSLDITSSIAEVYTNIGASSFDRIEVANFNDLDAFPEPVKVVKPMVPRKLMGKNGRKTGVFRFFIDTEGRVRLAHVDRVEGKVDIRLLEAAQDALEQWRFDPPTVRGRPVIVEVAQPFTFDGKG